MDSSDSYPSLDAIDDEFGEDDRKMVDKVERSVIPLDKSEHLSH